MNPKTSYLKDFPDNRDFFLLDNPDKIKKFKKTDMDDPEYIFVLSIDNKNKIHENIYKKSDFLKDYDFIRVETKDSDIYINFIIDKDKFNKGNKEARLLTEIKKMPMEFFKEIYRKTKINFNTKENIIIKEMYFVPSDKKFYNRIFILQIGKSLSQPLNKQNQKNNFVINNNNITNSFNNFQENNNINKNLSNISSSQKFGNFSVYEANNNFEFVNQNVSGNQYNFNSNQNNQFPFYNYNNFQNNNNINTFNNNPHNIIDSNQNQNFQKDSISNNTNNTSSINTQNATNSFKENNPQVNQINSQNNNSIQNPQSNQSNFQNNNSIQNPQLNQSNSQNNYSLSNPHINIFMNK